MDLKNLIVFVQTVRCGNFSSAAVKLGVTPPAVSKSIARLEEQLGVRLFNRTTRHLHLTSEGSAFFDRINALLDQIDRAVDDVHSATDEPKGLLRVAVEGNFGRYCLVPHIADFFARYPDIELELDFTTGPTDWIDRGIDVCIRHGIGDQQSCVSRPLPLNYPIMLLASPVYLAKRGVPRTIDDLAKHDCIGISMLKETAHWRLSSEHKNPQVSAMPVAPGIFPVPRTRLTTVGGYHGTDLMAALTDVGICFAPILAALPYLEAGHLKIVLPEYRMVNTGTADNRIFVLYPDRQYLLPKARVFVDFLLEKFGTGKEPMDLTRFCA